MYAYVCVHVCRRNTNHSVWTHTNITESLFIEIVRHLSAGTFIYCYLTITLTESTLLKSALNVGNSFNIFSVSRSLSLYFDSVKSQINEVFENIYLR